MKTFPNEGFLSLWKFHNLLWVYHGLGIKRAKDLKRHTTEEDIQIINRHMGKYSTSLVTRDMQIQTVLRYHFIPLRTAEIKNTNHT